VVLELSQYLAVLVALRDKLLQFAALLQDVVAQLHRNGFGLDIVALVFLLISKPNQYEPYKPTASTGQLTLLLHLFQILLGQTELFLLRSLQVLFIFFVFVEPVVS
jgi:hypothetical protein